MLSKNQEEASEKDSTEESQQDIAANEKGIYNLETEEIKRESQPLQHPACTPLMESPPLQHLACAPLRPDGITLRPDGITPTPARCLCSPES